MKHIPTKVGMCFSMVINNKNKKNLDLKCTPSYMVVHILMKKSCITEINPGGYLWRPYYLKHLLLYSLLF